MVMVQGSAVIGGARVQFTGRSWGLTGFDFRTEQHEHITTVLRDLHWLPVHQRIHFKILLMTFKCLNQLAPSYLSDLLIHYRPSRTLRSSDKELLVQPRCHLKTYGERAFSFIAPKLWNTLPLSIKRCNSAESFKSTLKTYLFRNYFEL